MIVPMKKIAIIAQEKDAQDALKKLRRAGLLHIEHQQEPKAKDITLIQEDIGLLKQALEVINKLESAGRVDNPSEIKDWKAAALHIVDSWKRLDQLQEFSRSLIQKIEEWRPWEDFLPQSLQELTRHNVYVRFFQAPKTQLSLFPADAAVEVVFTKANMAYCVVISDHKFDAPFKEIEPPKIGLSAMQKHLEEDYRVMRLIREDLKKFISQEPYFLKLKVFLEKELEFAEVMHGVGKDGSLFYVAGFAPVDAQDNLLALTKEERWGFYSRDPGGEEAVPTLLRNPRWVSLIQPLFKLIEVVPGYHEIDISLWFLFFFSLFFGIIIGDAGYGAVYMALTFIAQRKWGRKVKNQSVFFLFYLLSFCAIIWGILSGTVFGTELLKGIVSPLLPALASSRNIQVLCFFIGATHLSIAHLWRFILKMPSLTALVDAGWILVLWGVFFLSKLLILGEAFPGFANWLFISGITLVILFTSPQKNILKAFGLGLSNILLSLANTFTDVVSYVRLFAVGLAGVAVADAFTLMAKDIGFSNIFIGLASSLILIAGHGLNILLGPMSVLVHAVRLNVLEFCGHADVKWSGFSYKPFCE